MTNFKTRTTVDKKTGLTKQQEFQIGQVMEKVLTETSKGWVYKEGWSDQAIATACGSIARDLSEWQVTRIRKQLFGELAKKNTGSPLSILHNRVTDLIARVEELESKVALLELEKLTAPDSDNVTKVAFK